MTGWADPWPLQWGGSPTPIENALAALESAVGRGHAADADGIERRWREARAVGLGCLMVLAERAANQSYPQSSVDVGQWRRSFFLPDYLSDEAARVESTRRYFDDDLVSIPDLTAQLQRIDSRFSLVPRDWTDALTTMDGRFFESFDGRPPFGVPEKETRYPHRSGKYELVVKLDLGAPVSPLGEVELRAVRTARDYLQDALPTWYDFTICTSTGMLAGTSPIAWTVF